MLCRNKNTAMVAHSLSILSPLCHFMSFASTSPCQCKQGIRALWFATCYQAVPLRIRFLRLDFLSSRESCLLIMSIYRLRRKIAQWNSLHCLRMCYSMPVLVWCTGVGLLNCMVGLRNSVVNLRQHNHARKDQYFYLWMIIPVNYGRTVRSLSF